MFAAKDLTREARVSKLFCLNARGKDCSQRTSFPFDPKQVKAAAKPFVK